MSIQINNNFDYKGNQPNFERDRFETLELMCSADKRSFDNGHISYCEETGKHYVFNENNAIDVKTGKWRLLIENQENLDTNKQDKTDNALDTTDKTVVGAINEINGNTLDNVTFSADYKNIIINRKNGLNPYTIPIASIINNAKIIELNDVDSTDIGNGKTLVYDGATQKHKYVSSIGTDELVKMDSTTDAKYLSELIDKSTVVNDNGVLKVKKLDGQEVTIAEINHLKGLTMNVMDLVNAFANGGVKVYERTMPTYADLLTLDRSGFINEIKYFVYVQSDETHGGAKTTYLCDKTSETFFGNADSQRNFITNPIDLANEVTGKLGISNIDVDTLWKLLTINDTYKTLTTKDEVFGTHGAKALYDELVADIGKKANATDLTTHTNDTNIHVTTSDKTKWNKVDNKIDKTAITTTINSASTAGQVPSAKSVWDNSLTKAISDANTRIPNDADLNDYLTPGIYTCQTSSIANTLLNCPHKASNFKLFVNQNTGETVGFYGYQMIVGAEFATMLKPRVYYRSIEGEKSNPAYSKWQRVCTTSVADVEKTKFMSESENVDGAMYYTVKNGICFVFLAAIELKKVGQGNIVCSNMPKTSIFVSSSLIKANNGGEQCGFAYMTENVPNVLYVHAYEVSRDSYCSFSYPVMEG